MKIILDAMGGDNAPQAIVDGAVRARQQLGVDITLVGDRDIVAAALKKSAPDADTLGIEIRHASEVIDMHEDPTNVIRVKKDSSMVVGLNMLKNGEGDAFVSAGSTGALLSGATLIVKRVRGIRRAAVAPLIPSESGGVLIIDSGANVECTPEMLLQFAYMGMFYAQGVLGKANPRIGLLSNGTEDTKGGALRLETHKLLREAHNAGAMNFIGNVEANDPILGRCDVVVCDGFSGNILLKASEGAATFVMNQLKLVFFKNKKSKLAALLIRRNLKSLRSLMNPDTVGGTVMLGIAKPVVKAHGSSKADAIFSAVKQAIAAVTANVAEKLADNMAHLVVADTSSENPKE
ncbi:MAG: phosphate acyltransferase PlsX [Oscillospiraceae bacterium]|nr:phosphate acyltransferase PlsX [Oscillospiraceae bacterium]